MSDPLQIVLLGATGMVGRAVMSAAVGRHDVRLAAIARREVPLPPGARMEMLVADPASWSEAILSARPAVVVIALGTTMRSVGGDKARFRSVDHDLVLEAARAAKAAGARQLIAVSSVGAAAGVANFYLSLKGETEDALIKLRFDRLDIVRPSLLLGKRAGPPRLGERIGMLVAPLGGLVLQGSLRRYRAIRADTVAQAILALAGAKPKGRFIHEYDALQRIVRTAER